MTMPSVLDVRSLLRQHRQSKAADIHDLARRLAAGETVAPEDILDSLGVSGTQEDEFLDLVDLCRRRAELRKTAAGIDALNQELVGIRAVMKKHRATLDEAESKYRAAIDPLARQEEETQSRLNLAQGARSSLSSSANTPKFLRDAVETARATLLKASAEVADKTNTIEKEQQRSDEAREELDRNWRGADRALAAFARPDAGRDHPAEWSTLCEHAKYGAHRAAVAREQLVALVSARDAAQAVFDDAEKAAFEF
jgi:chromosome segregation ATPase